MNKILEHNYVNCIQHDLLVYVVHSLHHGADATLGIKDDGVNGVMPLRLSGVITGDHIRSTLAIGGYHRIQKT